MIKAVSILATALFAFCSLPSATAQPRNGANDGHRPNILLIIGDDFGVDVTSSMYPGLIDGLVEKYGPSGLDHPSYRAIAGKPASTPMLDRLARQGTRFSNAWAQPYCSPTRASILTGLFPVKTKVSSYADPLSQKHASFVRMLKEEGGYSTAVFGKWHIAGLPGKDVDFPGMKPKEAGFDLFKGNMNAAIRTYWDYDYHVQDAGTAPSVWRTESPPKRSLPGVAPTTYAPVVKAADAVEWITAQERAYPDKPWFVWLAFNLSHATAQRAPSQMAVPNADTLDAEAYAEMKACGGTFGSANVGACTGEQLMRAMTNALDTVIGKVLDAVDALDPNTYVIYISDNGTPMYGRPNLDFIDNLYITRKGRGKGTAYESGARVAMAIRGPGIAANAENGDFVDAVDLFPTILGLAGLAAPANVPNSDGTGKVALDGVSLAPILFGQAAAVRDPSEDYLLAETLDLLKGSRKQVGARNATYKVVCTNGTGSDSCEFYNLVADPLEEYPLAKPERCSGYTQGAWTRSNPAWNYCRLTEIVRTRSFLATH
jgi:arylsulfatase A-like enzyme